jgi:branched-chain amino acid transport system substrate-binding protein
MKYWKTIVLLAVACFMLPWAFSAGAQDILIGFSGPLSGPAGEYGRDMVNGIDMAIKEINATGGVTVGGKKHKFKLEKLDDKADPTVAVNNCRRMRTNGAIAVFNGVFTTIAAINKINQEKGNEFLIMAYTSTPKVYEMGNKLLIGVTAPPFTVYMEQFADTAMKKGYKKIAMIVTLGAYGEEWRIAFKEHWTKLGGTITADKPANYYTETDFSTQLAAALATKPDCLFVGGPSTTTALVIDQARDMGFKGGIITTDQAKLDKIARILGGYELMNNTIGVATPMSVPVPASEPFEKKYKETYKRMVTSEGFRNYGGMIALARAIEKAGTAIDAYKIRAYFSKVLPINGDSIPSEIFGINEKGGFLINGSTQNVENNQLTPPVQYFWWIKSDEEWEEVKRITRSTANMVRLPYK